MVLTDASKRLKNILLLEDHPLAQDICKTVLSDLLGRDVSFVVTDCLSRFRELYAEGAFDLIISDLNVLDAKPPEVAESLLQMGEEFRLRTIVHSTEPMDNLSELGLLSQFPILPKGASRSLWEQIVFSLIPAPPAQAREGV